MKKLSEKKLLSTPVFSVYENLYHMDKHNKAHPFYVIHSNDWVNTIPITPDGHIILVKQYRIGIDKYSIEIPGGVIEDNESPINAAIRETKEETGYEGSKVIEIGCVIPNPAIQNNKCHTFLIVDAKKTSNQNLDHTEEIEVLSLPLNDVLNMIKTGKINHSLVVAAFNFYHLYNS